MGAFDESLMEIERELGNIVHAAIEDLVEDAITDRPTGWSAPLLGYSSEELSEFSELPEVSRKCPFCEKTESEHYDLARHIAREHPKEAIKNYKEYIEYYYNHPMGTGERHSLVTNIFGGPKYESDTKFCPFCERPLSERDMKRHVVEKHGAFMEIFRKVLKE